MQTYDKANAEQFANEIYTMAMSFKGSPLNAESMYYLQLELDEMCNKWKARIGFLPEVEGDFGTGSLKRLVVVQDGTDSIRVNYEVDEDAEFVQKWDAVVRELMGMPGGLLEDGNGPS